MKTRILLTRSMLPVDIQYIIDGLNASINGKYELIIPDDYSEEALCRYAGDVDVFLGPFITPKLISSAQNLKLIQVPWTGMDTFDFGALKGKNLIVCNTHSNADAVAELGITMILDLLKKASYHDQKMRNGNWNRDQFPLDLKSKLLCNQTTCVLGYGNVGSRIGKLAHAFNSRVVAVDDQAVGNEIVSKAYQNTDIRIAVQDADIIVITLPLTEKTRNLIDDDMIALMKTGVIIVNMSRAAIIEENAIWNALVSGKVGAFGSDVWWNTPKRGESYSYPSLTHEFWKLDNVLMSPHRAGFVEGCLPHLDGAIRNLIAFSLGDKLNCVVDTEKGY